ncbi:porin [Pleionea litopenaei]|uniref:Porin n=1 Tax=Pleionea litopenaei TaxID=3070815 RepID=A0AA51RSY8_9GAMM|nr:porin [Pleionea sp. HL-JVS1]WMS87002.1 porin [Pleionea sp. HL-JVS1]
MKLLIFLIFLFPLGLYANESFRLSGFGNVAAVTNDSSLYGFRNDMAQIDGPFDGDTDVEVLSNLGLQLDISLSEHLDWVAQLHFSGQREHNWDRNNRLFFLKYKPTVNWEFRVGRTAIDLFQLSDYRDIDIAYPWVKVPTEVYGVISNRSIDGGDVTYSDNWKGIHLESKVFAGSSENEFSSYDYSESTNIRDIMGVRLTASTLDWTLSLRHSVGTIDNDTPSNLQLASQIQQAAPLWPNYQQAINNLVLKGASLKYTSVGGQYQFPLVTVMAEFNQIDSSAAMINGVNNGYVSISYPMEKNTFYFIGSYSDAKRYEFSDSVLDPVTLEPLIAAYQQTLDFFNIDQKTLSLGWNYEWSSNIAIGVQWDNTKISENGGALWLVKDYFGSRPEETVNLVIVSVSFSF